MEIKKRIKFNYRSGKTKAFYEVWFEGKYQGTFNNIKEAKHLMNQLFETEKQQ